MNHAIHFRTSQFSRKADKLELGVQILVLRSWDQVETTKLIFFVRLKIFTAAPIVHQKFCKLRYWTFISKMIKSKVSSPHYNFHVKSPYSKSKDPSNQIKVTSADRFNRNSKFNSSTQNLKRSLSENAFREFTSVFEADILQNSTLDNSSHPLHVPTSQVIPTTKRKFPQRVTSQNFFPLMNKK